MNAELLPLHAGSEAKPLGIVFLHHRTDAVTLNNLKSFREWNPEAIIVTMSAGEPLEGGYSITHFQELTNIWNQHTKLGDLRGRSADLLLYAWYLNKREKCERWLIVEWDTYCTAAVEAVFHEVWEHDLMASHVQWPLENPHWYWWKSHRSLPLDLHRFAAGIVPFSCILVKDSALEAITQKVPWNQLGCCNGELRFATLANACGFPPVKMSSGNQHIDWQPIPRNTELRNGLFHPVKWLVDGYPGGGGTALLDEKQAAPASGKEPRGNPARSAQSILGTRTEIINWLIKMQGFRSYLEIGIGSGENFQAVHCPEKTGIDPALDRYAEAAPTHRMTSDEFFAQNQRKFDLILIDGLHHAEVVTRDLDNALAALTPLGMIVCHDLNPNSELMQRVPRETDDWTGDCWKAWVELRKQREDLVFAVADTDYGVGVIFPDGTPKTPKLDIDAAFLEWPNFDRHRKEWLPLVSPARLTAALGIGDHSPPLAVVTLWRPTTTNTQQAVMDYLASEQFPRGTRFIWTVERGCATCQWLDAQLKRVEAVDHDYFIEVLDTPSMPSHSDAKKHATVAALYNEVIAAMRAPLVFSVEDDVVPRLGTWGQLCGTLAGNERAAAVMAAYPSRQRPGHICAGTLEGNYPPMEYATSGARIRATWIAAGCTLYKTVKLRKHLPIYPQKTREGRIIGWDMTLSEALRGCGDDVMVDASCPAERRCK